MSARPEQGVTDADAAGDAARPAAPAASGAMPAAPAAPSAARVPSGPQLPVPLPPPGLLPWLRIRLRIAAAVATLLGGFAVQVLLFPLMGARGRGYAMTRWSRLMLRACGVRRLPARVAPEAAPGFAGALVLANHVSWLDILVLAALHPTHFVSKSEVGDWPLIGAMAKRMGTLFIERGRRHAVHSMIKLMATTLGKGESCTVFPEGTTGDGTTLLPFHANLLQAAVESGAPVQPVGLRYLRDGRPTLVTAYCGDISLGQSACAVLGTPGIEVELVATAPIASAGLTRHELADRTRAAIAAALGMPG
ncbi:lysophospholipid acyltransferase family protein [Derxia gummosa]|uniref:Lysophospholipid acyltransferase family protein n=1 Tax=Derxia gummosa DSM 723 TaxID=1121388 RepID=A0A8B6X9C3_9BURK|nr:lysophospholipid acyltransferase family protein [Derxia gummosa]